MAFDAYLKIDGIDGEATDDKHAKWIGVQSYSVGVSQPHQGSVSSGGGRTAGRADAKNLVVNKMIDMASPKLQLYCCEGTSIPKITLEVCQHTGEKHTFATVTLEDAIISSINVDGKANGDTNKPMESVSFAYSTISWEYTPIDNKGKKQAAVKQGWDFDKNKKK